MTLKKDKIPANTRRTILIFVVYSTSIPLFIIIPFLVFYNINYIINEHFL